MDEPTSDAIRIRLRRMDMLGSARDRFRQLWSRRRWRWLMIALGALLGAYFLFWLIFARGLPDARTLLDYQPPLPTVVRDVNGEPVYSFARERRVQLQYSDFPPMLVNAYLAAEDKTFFSHHGVDFPGFAGAVVDYASKVGSGQRAKGGSTITQQVAKNLLIGDEYSPQRKIREMVLAWRMENVLTKQQILELYLNQIFLGRNAYGVQAASRAYFDKDLGQLTLPEMAYLAILPKGPSNYQPETNMQRALDRRNWVLKEMLHNKFINESQYETARAAPLGTVALRGTSYQKISGYYVEEIRRRLIAEFGEKAEDGPNSVYAGGLWVRSPIDPKMQGLATKALRNGMLRYDRAKGWSGPIRRIDVEKWRAELIASNLSTDFEQWAIAVVIAKDQASATIGFANGKQGTLPAGLAQMPRYGTATPAFNFLRPGDVIAVRPEGTEFALRSIPGISGGMMIEGVHTGRVYAMQGGFDARLSSYNRVTQAERQPGSTIKPFVYAAALDNGMTPASIIIDGPFCIYQNANLGQKCFKNFDNKAGSGPHTMRWGVEQSRNLMTVRTAAQIGMPRVVKTIANMGIGNYQPYLAFSLGAGETTVERMVNAFAMLANHGRQLTPKVMDYVQDRTGKVIWPKDWRACQGCNAQDWDGKPMPRFTPSGRQLMNPMTAYQVVHITEGVIQRGTATVLRDLNRPLFGKTGTTSGPTNVWFIGGSPDIVGGLYLGYDQPRNLGGYAQGGTMAAPIWKEAMGPILQDMPKTPFVAPPGIRMVRIERRTGKRIFGGGWPASDPLTAIIWEAFKPETEPRRTIRSEEMADDEAGRREEAARAAQREQQSRDFAGEQGGIY
ncbi:MAG: transglycosylase domain-containing protein [Sphingobium sp.]|nr:transglycosylase domain-containing protein [Sphingobium sp.]